MGVVLLDVRHGDPTVVFAELFDRYQEGLLRYLTRRVGPVADDLVAETFVAALTGRAAFDPDRGGPGPWLYGIATNLLRHHLRHEQRGLAASGRAAAGRLSSYEGPAEAIAGVVDAQRRVALLADGIAALIANDRDVLLLTAWAGLSSTEVAAALQIPVGTVRSRLHRVRQHLRTHEQHRLTLHRVEPESL
ncbi:MAG: sigma-70 family RNA polymerase sigma factor [Nakamurella sp.]